MSATMAGRAATAAPSGPARHVGELEGLRAIAAGAVLLTHAGFMSGAIGRNVLPGFLARMDIGVAVFFVLSGYLLYRPHARATAGLGEPVSVRTFFARRAARLAPAWLLVLIGTPLLVSQARLSGADVWIANLLQLQALKQSWLLPGLAQLWSLSTEVMFYLALPFFGWLLLRLCRGRRPWVELAWIGVLAVLAQAFRASAQAGLLLDGYTWLQTLPATMDWFAAGMALATLTAHPDHWVRVKGAIRDSGLAIWTIAGCLVWVLTTRLAGPYDLVAPTAGEQTFKHLGYLTVALLVVAPSVVGARSPIASVLASRPMAYLGKISYAVFLWHLPVMFAVRAVLGFRLFDGHFWMTLGGTTTLTLVIAAASWHFVEEPCQRLVRQRTTVRGEPNPPR